VKAKKKKKLTKGEWFGQHSVDIGFLDWHDRKRVAMNSTHHTDEVCP
jgi:hypothetical protein